MTRLQRKKRFIHQLAVFLAGNQAVKSIELSLQKPSAIEWRDLIRETPLFGYPTVKAAEKELTEFLG